MSRACYPDHTAGLNSGLVHGGGGWRRGVRKMRAGFPETQARRRDKMSGRQVRDLKILPAAGRLHTRSMCG